MKRTLFFLLLILSFLSSACTKDLQDRIDILETSSKELETSVEQMQISIDSLKAVIGKYGKDTLSFSFDSDKLIPMSPNSSRTVNYEAKSSYSDHINVETIAQGNINAVLTPSEDGKTGTIEILTGQTIADNSKLVIFVSDGKSALMFSLCIEAIGLTIEGESEFECGYEGGEVTLEYLSNVSCTVNIPEDAKGWLSVAGTKAMTERSVLLQVDQNDHEGRTAKVVLTTPDGSCSISYTIIQAAGKSYELQQERAVLEHLFQTTGGEQWNHHDNWCSAAEVGSWYGITTDQSGYVMNIIMGSNNINGVLPDEIWGLSHLQNLMLIGNGLVIHIPADPDSLSSEMRAIDLGNYSNAIGTNTIKGGLPASISKMQKLSDLSIINAGLTGTIPDELWSIPDLQTVYLGYNHLEGEISPAIGQAQHLRSLSLCSNGLEGVCPEEMANLSELVGIQLGNTTSLTGYPDAILSSNHITRLPSGIGNMKNLQQISMQSTGLEELPESICDCENLCNVSFGSCDNTGNYVNNFGKLPERIGNLKKLYNAWFHYCGLTGPLPESIWELESIQTLLLSGSTLWNPSFQGKNEISGSLPDISKLKKLSNLQLDGNFLEGNIPDSYADNPELTRLALDYNKLSGKLSEKIISCDNFAGWTLDPQRDGYGLTIDMYESKDYSRHGNIIQLQQATKGEGIDLVIMGDGFVDTELDDGTYSDVITKTVEDFFSVEPYRSFREWFNVFEVELVSKNNKFGLNAQTALSTRFGSGTTIYGDDALCFDFAEKAVGESRMDEVLVITVINRKYYAGTCFMYYPETEYDYGNGPAIAYFPLGTDDEMFAGLVRHEAGGHGFSKLDDEYYYEGTEISQASIQQRMKLQGYGWFANVDFTGDSTQVKWRRFLQDDRYSNEDLGVFQGGATYGIGVWRPSENSIMRYNTGVYNAPSREAIYKRIHKLGNGPLWNYDYEDFVAYDDINRCITKSSVMEVKRYSPLSSPVFIEKPWKNAENHGQVIRANTDRHNADGERAVFSNTFGNCTVSISGSESTATVNFGL